MRDRLREVCAIVWEALGDSKLHSTAELMKQAGCTRTILNEACNEMLREQVIVRERQGWWRRAGLHNPARKAEAETRAAMIISTRDELRELVYSGAGAIELLARYSDEGLRELLLQTAEKEGQSVSVVAEALAEVVSYSTGQQLKRMASAIGLAQGEGGRWVQVEAAQ